MPDIYKYISKYLTWKQSANNVSHNGMLQYKAVLRHFVGFLGEHNISNIEDITYDVLKDYQKYLNCQITMSGTVRKISSQNSKLSFVNVFLRWLVTEGFLISDPTVNIEYAKNPDKLDGDMSKNYPGGKGGVFHNLINLMPPHEVYIESHLGNGSVMRRKRPAKRNIGIEIDLNVIRMWNNDNQINFDLVHGDAITFLKGYKFTGKELVYCDPPYLRETRKKYNPLYKYEYKRDQHIELLKVIKTLSCNVIISGYQSTLYSEELQDWHLKTFQAATSNGVATECVWINYPPPVELHDYRYLGDNFRKREHMKKKKKRWIKRLNRMSAQDRDVLLNALQWVWAGCSDTYKLYDYHSLGDNFRVRERRNKKRQRWIKQLQTMPVLEKQTLLDAINTFDIGGNSLSLTKKNRKQAKYIQKVFPKCCKIIPL